MEVTPKIDPFSEVWCQQLNCLLRIWDPRYPLHPMKLNSRNYDFDWPGPSNQFRPYLNVWLAPFSSFFVLGVCPGNGDAWDITHPGSTAMETVVKWRQGSKHASHVQFQGVHHCGVRCENFKFHRRCGWCRVKNSL